MCFDGESCEVWNKRAVRARKVHRCIECHRQIPRGCSYVLVSSLYDGEWLSDRLHAECDALWGFVHEVVCGGEGLIMLGGLDEEIDELSHAEPFYEIDGAALRDNLREVWCEAVAHYPTTVRQ